MLRTLIIAAVLAGLAWWLFKPKSRPTKRSAARQDPYADRWTHVRTFRTPGGVATKVWKVERCHTTNRYGQPIWTTYFTWRCDCDAEGDGDHYLHHTQRDAIRHHELHAWGAA